jgi:hypothetical protein
MPHIQNIFRQQKSMSNRYELKHGGDVIGATSKFSAFFENIVFHIVFYYILLLPTVEVHRSYVSFANVANARTVSAAMISFQILIYPTFIIIFPALYNL